jgi:hypothetical protein
MTMTQKLKSLQDFLLILEAIKKLIMELMVKRVFLIQQEKNWI